MERKQWRLLMGIENDKVHFQVLPLDNNEIHHNFTADIRNKEFSHIKTVINRIAPKKKDVVQQGFSFAPEEIFIYALDGAYINKDGQEVACNRIGAVDNRLPSLILSYFQEDKKNRKNKKTTYHPLAEKSIT